MKIAVANMTRTPQDTRDPRLYATRVRAWRSWMLERGATAVTFATRLEAQALITEQVEATA